MADISTLNPAEVAAKKALNEVFRCIDEGKSFRLEAGAGAGKTYSLIKALQYLIQRRGSELIRRHQKIACITFTNVAKDEIEARTDRHPAIQSDTIHGFCWSVLKDFQPQLRSLVSSLEMAGVELEKVGGIGSRRVEYDFGYFRVNDDLVSIHHDDVLVLMAKCLESPKFRRIVTARYPILFIDEYQDTDATFIEAIKTQLLDTGDGPLIGFFGDHWQKIYGSGCGKVEHPAIQTIGKEANFRSVGPIVDCLNRMRPDLQQMVEDPNAPGFVTVFHANEWRGKRRSGSHWKDDVPEEVAHAYLEHFKAHLSTLGWDFSPAKTKILMLTHNILAKEQGYPSLSSVFSRTESYIKKEDPYIEFFLNTFEPAVAAFKARRFGEMMTVLGSRMPAISSPAVKIQWSTTMEAVSALRGDTVGALIDGIRESQVLRLPDKLEKMAQALRKAGAEPIESEPKDIQRLRKLREVPYKEIIALGSYVEGSTPFATKHGVKGAEFENVLVVVGRGWNQYNFGQMLELAGKDGGIPVEKVDFYERNRNLFYVACSRPRKRLAILFTQLLSDAALKTLYGWFGATAVEALPADI